MREALNEQYKKTRERIESGETHLDNLAEGFTEADRVLRKMLTVDAVEVVRCRDCRYARPLNNTEKLVYLDECNACYNGEATIDGYNIVMPKHFCSYGERKED